MCNPDYNFQDDLIIFFFYQFSLPPFLPLNYIAQVKFPVDIFTFVTSSTWASEVMMYFFSFENFAMKIFQLLGNLLQHYIVVLKIIPNNLFIIL